MIQSLILLWTCGVMFCWTILGTNGQGTMLDPPSRSSLWRLGFDTPINENDKLLSCGGVKHRWMVNNGRCGVCGDPWDSNPRPNEAGGLYASGVISDVYVTGAVIQVVVEVAVDNGGYFEFRLCANNNLSRPVTQECLDKGLMNVSNSTKSNSTRFTQVQQGLNTVQLQLPLGVVCDQCVLQWKYRTADHMGCEKNEETNEQVCAFGLGKVQTEYFSCADVAIYNEHHVRSLQVSAASGLNTVSVQAPEQDKSRGKRAVMQTHRTIIFPNGQIQVMEYGTPFSHVAPYMTMMTGGNGPLPFDGPGLQQFQSGREMRWGWNGPMGPENTGDPAVRMRRRVQESMQGATNQQMQMLPGQSFRNNNMRIEDPSNINVGAGEMFPGTGPLPQNLFQTNDQGATGRQLFQVQGRHGITTIQVERGSGPVMQGGHQNGAWVQESISRMRMRGNQGQGLPVPAMAQAEPPSVKRMFNSQNTVAVSSSNQGQIPDLNPRVNQQTSQQQTIKKLFLSTKQCNACPFDQCLDDYLNLENIFPGLFENPTKFLECRKYEKLFTLKNYDLVSDGLPDCTHPRFRRQLQQVSNQHNRQFDDDDVGCCGTRSQVILPLTVESDNETYNVVQLPNDRNQFLVQGICGRNQTVTCSTCEAENNFQWVLVFDPRSDSRPPVSFVPVKFPHYCRCMNVAMKRVIRT